LFSLFYAFFAVVYFVFFFFLFFRGGVLLDFFLFSFLGFDFSFCFVVDFVSLGFAGCVSVISSVVFLYRVFYMGGSLDLRRFGYLVFLFVASMFFLVFSGNFFTTMVG
jgi:NADH:ubiquinone oxidoreductase subunit 5 (subunit L)/multisubunit Na+/H+ antiporter MnhA subunit